MPAAAVKPSRFATQNSTVGLCRAAPRSGHRRLAGDAERSYHGGVEKIDCVIPAAGASTRMGKPKLLLPFRGRTIIEISVAAVLSACAHVILVAGSGAEAIRELFSSEPRVILVDNPDWESGMFSSLYIGIGHVETQRFFVALGDMPLIRPEVYHALMQAPATEVAAPEFKGMRGHPVLLGPAVKEAVLSSDSASGSMRKIISKFGVTAVPWDDDTVLSDVDTPDDYARI
jgi:molybdenum cofactor cytidylyltransferase